MKKNQYLLGYLYAICATAIWSGNFIVARGLHESIPPVSLAFWRWVVAVIVFLPFTVKTLIREKETIKQNIPYICTTALLGITIFNTLVYYAGQTTTAINLSLISITCPLFIVVLSRLIFKELITRYKTIGIILVGMGVVTLITKGNFSELTNISLSFGDLWMLLAAVIFALYSIMLRRKPKQLSVWALQMTTFLLGLIFLLPFYIWENINTPPVEFDTTIVYSILYVGIFASLLAFIFWSKAIVIVGPTRAGMIYYTLPLFSSLLAFLFLGESVTSLHYYSAALIVLGIFIANFRSTK